MRKLFYIITLFVFGNSIAQVQKLTPSRIETVVFKADSFVGYDGFSNLFFTKNNVLYKKVDNLFLEYQNVSLGKITKVDLTNPLKVVIFY